MIAQSNTPCISGLIPTVRRISVESDANDSYRFISKLGPRNNSTDGVHLSARNFNPIMYYPDKHAHPMAVIVMYISFVYLFMKR